MNSLQVKSLESKMNKEIISDSYVNYSFYLNLRFYQLIYDNDSNELPNKYNENICFYVEAKLGDFVNRTKTKIYLYVPIFNHKKVIVTKFFINYYVDTNNKIQLNDNNILINEQLKLQYKL